MNTETKRHIDAARQVLVGVVPNPTSQIDQITNALIYKFMDDMDQSAIKQGGEPSFFVKDLKNYAWTRLMDARVGNQERMNIYSEALVKFSESKQLPQLFREIFKSAFLPYRSPEVLGLFLKEISYFDYSHPEELGNAYEYLLSIMSSQGDAGQFRTPRHIIDFIVAVVNPTAEDKVLDPACGTGGFLVSAYKHILKQHDGINTDGTKNKEKPLTPDQRKNLMGNFEGYDVDPGMVRIAQVNMYLHQFKNPKVYNYNTLSMDERWGDKFSVILANPPFMSPKGGVSTHSKFSIQSSRSEVLFVDYIMNHLRPNGRAGIIVPEGIIFQSGTAYKQLRKNLVEDGLFAVVSLPSGVFNPYAGVKTSILLFDNTIAKQSEDILFVKIENDGFDLGAQRRPIEKNDLPRALALIHGYKTHLQAGRTEIAHEWGNSSDFSVAIKKSKIVENDDFNLSGDRYRVVTDYTDAKWPTVKLGEITQILNGYTFKSEKYTNKGIRIIRITNVQKGEIVDDDPKFYSDDSYKEIEKFLLTKNDLLISLTGNVGRVGLIQSDLLPAGLNQRVGCIRLINEEVLIDYIFCVLNTDLFENDCIRASSGAAQKNLSTEWLKKYQIPLPPLEIQKQVVEQITGYQKIIDGIQQAVSNWKPVIEIDAKWDKVKIGDVAKLTTGGTPLTSKKEYYGGDIKWLVSGDINMGEIFDCKGRITDLAMKESNAKLLPVNSVLIALNGQGKTRGTVAILRTKATCNQSLVSINPDTKKLNPEFLLYILKNKYQEIRDINGDNQRGGLNMPIIRSIEIPLPPIEIQNKIVESIEVQHTAIKQAKSLIPIFEQHIKNTLAKIWEK